MNIKELVDDFTDSQKLPNPISSIRISAIVGLIAFSLPIILYAGDALYLKGAGWAPRESISSYYYSTLMRDVFVGLLFVVGAMLFAYEGFSKLDKWTCTVGSVMAVLIGLFPTEYATTGRLGIHEYAAIALFLILAFLCLYSFTNHSERSSYYFRKDWRFWTYFLSGLLIIISMLGIAIFPDGPSSTFVFESIALFSFGIAWGTKSNHIYDIMNR